MENHHGRESQLRRCAGDFALDAACRLLNEAFDCYGCYLVGSSLERPDWRDVDVRMIFGDEEFAALFPGERPPGAWENDARWLVLTISISAWLKAQTGLPVDFQMQPMTHANVRHDGRRDALGTRLSAN